MPSVGSGLLQEIERLRLAAPRLGGTKTSILRRGDDASSGSQQGRLPTTRHGIDVQVLGEADLLACWPDTESVAVPPVDKETVDEAGGLTEVGFGDPEDVSRYWHASQLWTLGEVDPFALKDEPFITTHRDLTTLDEEAVEAGRLDLKAEFDARCEYIRPIVAAIAAQTDRFYVEEAVSLLAEAVRLKADELRVRHAVTSTLAFPNEWKMEEPRLAPRTAAPANAAPSDADNANKSVSDIKLTLVSRARLDPATFRTVQHTIRHWANAVERYPETFGQLEEDRVSDLLCATLNATLPGAKREVYTRRGKSDIFISADKLREGMGPAQVFVCETKWATSRGVVGAALDPQLFGYLNVHDTSAVLVILCPQKGFRAAQKTYLSVLERVAGYAGTRDGPAGWPILSYRNEGRQVDVCAAFIHLPR